MLADQVVHAVAAAGGLGDHVVVIQLIKAAAGVGDGDAVEGRGRADLDAGTGVQAEPAEQPLLAGREVVIRQVERRRDRQVLGPHELEPVTRGRQLFGQSIGGPGGVVVQLAGQHADRQRQISAQPGDLPDCRVIRTHVRTTRQPDQQNGSFIGRQAIQADRRGVVQGGEVPTAGDQDQAASRPRQQRLDLLMPGRVIQNQQQPLADQLRAP